MAIKNVVSFVDIYSEVNRLLINEYEQKKKDGLSCKFIPSKEFVQLTKLCEEALDLIKTIDLTPASGD